MAVITIDEPGVGIRVIDLMPGKELNFGRSLQNDIILSHDPRISNRHCRIYWSPEKKGFILSDLHSTNGTILNLDRISADIVLKNNDKIRFGDVRILFSDVEDGETKTRKIMRSDFPKHSENGVSTDTCVIPNFSNIRKKPQMRIISGGIFEKGAAIGPYIIDSKIASATMASVYRVHKANENETPYALKIYDISFDIHHEALDDYQNLLIKLQKIENPYFVKYMDFGNFNGFCYFVMPLVSMPDLNELIARKAPFPEYNAICIIFTLASALNSLYNEYHISHEDFSPSSVMINDSFSLLIKGHGLSSWMAKYLGQESVLSQVWYVAPERFEGASSWFSDQYSLGILFFQLLTGYLPFNDESVEAVKQMQKEKAFPHPHEKNPNIYLSPISLQILQKMVEKKPENRYSSWNELLQDLEHSGQQFQQEEAVKKECDDTRVLYRDKINKKPQSLEEIEQLLTKTAVGTQRLPNEFDEEDFDIEIIGGNKDQKINALRDSFLKKKTDK